MQRDLDGVMPEGMPEGWSYRRLQDVAAHITKGATPTTYGFAWESVGNKGTVPFMRSECVQDGKLVPRMMEAISPKAHAMMARSAVHGGDLLMTITGNIGRVCRYPASASEANINQHIARIRLVRPDLVDPDYAFWALHNPRQQSRLTKDLTGLAYPQIGLAQVQAIPLPSPPLPEQCCIAKILDTLDEAIRKTEQVIAKLQQMKQGLLHDLLTRGIDENGELRDPERHPEQFKDSVLGRIPRGWEVLSIGNLANFVNGNNFKQHEWTEHGEPIIRIQNLNGEISFNYYSGVVVPEWRVSPGDLLFAWSGTLESSFGPRIWRGPAGVLNQHIFRVEPDIKTCDKYFLETLLHFCLPRIAANAHGFKSSFVHVTRHELTSVLVAVPSLEEQMRINVLLDSVVSRVQDEVVSRDKLVSLKHGLMDDLLTGRVRVAVPEEATS
jgi:type I restriction enzyme S subunit